MFDEFVFVPWDDPGDDVHGESVLTHRIRSVLTFVHTSIVPLLKKEYQQSTSIVSAVCNIILSIAERSPRVGNGLGRGVNRLFYGMVDFGTNVIHSYDGTLSTDLPPPLGVSDDAGIRSTSLPVQSTVSAYLIDTRVVWTLLFHTGYVFDSPRFLNDRDAGGAFVNVEFPGPIQTLDKHMGVFSYCE